MSTNFKKASLSNFDIYKIAESEGGYNYYVFVHPEGQVLVMREKTDGTEYLFANGGYSPATAYTNRASLSYDNRSNL
jgi:hypothetical protein